MIILSVFQNFISNSWEKFDNWLSNLLKFDEYLDLVVTYIKDMPELLKWGLSIFLSIIIILGLIAFIKKLFKLFVILAIIGAIILVIWKT